MSESDWRLTSEKLLQKCKVFDVYEEQFARDASKQITRFTVRHPGAVVFLPVTSEGTVLLVEQYRAPLRRTLLEAPAGTLEPDEEPLLCAQREIQEEVGMKASEWISLGELFPAPGFCDEHQYLFLARGLTPSVLEADEDEDISVVELSFQEFERQVLSGEIVDAKTLAIYCRALSSQRV